MVNQNTVFVDYETLPNGDVNYIPLLPHRQDGKLTFPYKNMVGTWCSVELKEALRLGYEIEEVFEAIVWDKQSRGLFTDFLKFGIMNKIYSSKVGEEEYDEFVKENAVGELPFPEIGQDWKLPTDNTFHFKCDLDEDKFNPIHYHNCNHYGHYHN